ncbi:MAG: anti-sigma factor family protein [Solirubrobacteraceae bacterium]
MKVNRCLTEGRRRFLDRYAEIASGAECRRWESVLSALADGEASPKDLTAVRPHLRNCPACRAHVRELRESTRRVAVLLPVPVAVEVADHGSLLARIHDAVIGHLQERAVLTATKLQTGLEAAAPAKFAVVAASAAAIGGGVAVERAVTERPSPAPAERAAAPARAPTAAVAPKTVVREPTPPAPAMSAPKRKPVTRRVVVRRTTKSEFGLSGGAKTASADSTAAREFSTSGGPATTGAPATAAAAAAAPVTAPPANASRDERTAAAEFGG